MSDWSRPRQVQAQREKEGELARLIEGLNYWQYPLERVGVATHVNVQFGPRPSAWVARVNRPNKRRTGPCLLACLTLPEDWKETVYDLGCALVPPGHDAGFVLHAEWQESGLDLWGRAVIAWKESAFPSVTHNIAWVAGHGGFWAVGHDADDVWRHLQNQLEGFIGLNNSEELPF